MDAIPCDWVGDYPGCHHQRQIQRSMAKHGRLPLLEKLQRRGGLGSWGGVVGEEEGGEAAVRI